jgi:hypothetical protein
MQVRACGNCRLSVIVDKDRVETVKITAGHPILTKARARLAQLDELSALYGAQNFENLGCVRQ